MPLRADSFVVLFLGLPAIGASCQTAPPPPPPLPVVVLDGGAVVDACGESCRVQRALQCPGASGKSTPKGVSCEQVCRDQTGMFGLHPECVAVATTCAAVLACFK